MLVQEQAQTYFMHLVVLGERERFPDEAAQPLPQNVVEAFNVASLSCSFACGLMLALWQYVGIDRPEIRVTEAASVNRWDALPQKAASGFASVAHRVGDDLARPTALRQPDPAFVLAEADE